MVKPMNNSKTKKEKVKSKLIPIPPSLRAGRYGQNQISQYF
uniref:Uncharacterized protein n=1 Tax=Anguilla anguilla TaxID=7936 RepID=A0A0E9VC89_ANGAN